MLLRYFVTLLTNNLLLVPIVQTIHEENNTTSVSRSWTLPSLYKGNIKNIKDIADTMIPEMTFWLYTNFVILSL